MTDKTLLNHLCSICNTSESKYRCPGCDARTCSLPCYKRHQQWAQCSGKRDPTKFVKKSQLVTPAGIDHDYNFLSGIERNLAKAEVAATEAGANTASSSDQKEVNYHRLQSSGVTVIRAPRGLSRQKENKSHQSSTKRAKKNFVWTVEWYDETKRRVLTQTSSTERIQNADPFHGHEHKSKKRKLGPGCSTPVTTTTTPDLHSDNPAIIEPSPLQDQHGEHLGPTQDKSSERLEVDHQLKVDNEKPEHSIAGPGSTPVPTGQLNEAQENMATTHPRDDGLHGPNSESLGAERYRYFLLRPRTSSSRHVLIPLDDPSRTLGEALHGRTVLEFPTVYVFPASTNDLAPEFMLEEEYMQQEGEEQKEFDQLIHELDPEILQRLKEDDATNYKGRQKNEDDEVDSKKILDVLKQDLERGL